MLDDEQRQELVARLENIGDLGDTSTEEASEPTESTAEAAEDQGEDRQDAEPVAAEAHSEDVEASDSNNGRQSGAQRRISDLVRQRNSATEEFRELQDRYASLETQLQQMQTAPQEQQPQEQLNEQQFYDEYGNPVDLENGSSDMANLRAEFDQYRDTQVIEQVKTQLESEIQEAVSAHPGVDGQWLRKQLIDAVRLNGNADIAETAEYYSAFVSELQQNAVAQHGQASESQALAAPPRLVGRSTASGSASQQGDQPFTRDDARKRAYEIIRGS